MSWRGLLLLAPVWVGICAGIASRGDLIGGIVGAASWLFIAGSRFALEWADRYGRVGELRAALEQRCSAGRPACGDPGDDPRTDQERERDAFAEGRSAYDPRSL